MSTTFTWSISQIEYTEAASPEDRVVRAAHWTLTGSRGGHTASVYGAVSLAPREGSPFVPFTELTEARVSSWVRGVLGAAEVAALKEALEGQLNDLILPTLKLGPPPWAAEPA